MPVSTPLLDGILARRSASAKHLAQPAPDAATLDQILLAAARAPDHGRLVPFRFVRIAPAQRQRLADVLATAAQQANPDIAGAEIDRVREKALEGPCAIGMIARIDPDHPKIPASDQWLAAGCALENILLATQATGFGAAVKSGKHYAAEAVRVAFGLTAHEHYVCTIVLGTVTEEPPAKPKPALAQIVSDWA